jgi:hypothetical protein
LIDQSNESTTLSSDFVIQLDNFKEIPEYIRVAKELGFDSIALSVMWNWDTWSPEEFARVNVADPLHPQYQELLDVVAPFKGQQGIQGISRL